MGAGLGTTLCAVTAKDALDGRALVDTESAILLIYEVFGPCRQEDQQIGTAEVVARFPRWGPELRALFERHYLIRSPGGIAYNPRGRLEAGLVPALARQLGEVRRPGEPFRLPTRAWRTGRSSWRSSRTKRTSTWPSPWPPSEGQVLVLFVRDDLHDDRPVRQARVGSQKGAPCRTSPQLGQQQERAERLAGLGV